MMSDETPPEPDFIRYTLTVDLPPDVAEAWNDNLFGLAVNLRGRLTRTDYLKEGDTRRRMSSRTLVRR